MGDYRELRSRATPSHRDGVSKTVTAHAPGPGQSLTIVVGGATESLSAVPGTNDLTLKRRMGFIKLAVTEGADLVPVFSVRRSTPPRI